MSKPVILILACVLTGLAATARADAAAGDACAATLTSDGKQIYAAAMASKPAVASLSTTMETATRDLASAKKITGGGTARDNSMAAGKCVSAALK